jgi:hypothetical protein
MTSKALFALRTHTACIVRLPLGLQTLSSASFANGFGAYRHGP